MPRAQENWELIDKYDYQEPVYLSDEAVAEILDKASAIKKWVESVEAYALKEALSGKEVPGYKIVEGRSNRVLTNKEEQLRQYLRKTALKISTNQKSYCPWA